MTVEKKMFFLAFTAISAVMVCRGAQPYERYQTIVDRKPFGPEPVNFNPEAAPGSAAANAAGSGSGEMTEEQRTAEEQQLAASVRVSMINVTPSGAVAVGFTDSSAKPAENYYLTVGRSQNGWTVKNADPGEESVTLEKDGIEVTVKLGETAGGGKAKGSRARLAHTPRTLRTAQTGREEQAPPDGARLGGLARLRQRRAEMQARAEAEAEKKAQAAAVAAAEREEREAREAEEKRARAEREAQAEAERAQQRETLRQIQEQLRRSREANEATEQEGEVQGEADNAE